LDKPVVSEFTVREGLSDALSQNKPEWLPLRQLYLGMHAFKYIISLIFTSAATGKAMPIIVALKKNPKRRSFRETHLRNDCLLEQYK
jgi:hypothetical protein